MSTTQPSFATAVSIVTERELLVRLRSKSFVISTLLTIVLFGVLVGLSSILPDLFGGSDRIAATSEAAEVLASNDDIEVVPAANAEEVRELVSNGDADSGVFGSEGSPVGVTVVGNTEPPTSLIQEFSLTPSVELIDADAPSPFFAMFVGVGFAVVFMTSALTYGQTIASSIIEEKQSRIVEMLLAAIPTRALLVGKVIACTLLAFAQILLTAGAVIIGAALGDNTLVLDGLGRPIAWFVPLFMVGFVMIAALYAAAAAMVSRIEDLGSTSMPIMMMIMIPYVLVILFHDNPTVLAVMSYVPFSAAVGMPMRVFLDLAQWWEPLIALAIQIVTTIGVLLVATRIFEHSVLRSGAPLKLREALA